MNTLSNALVGAFKNEIERIKACNKEGFVVGWGDSLQCVRFTSKNKCQESGARVTIVSVADATTWSNEEVKVIHEGGGKLCATVMDEVRGEAVMLDKAAVCEQSIKQLIAAIKAAGGTYNESD